jgi:hypothetical protein
MGKSTDTISLFEWLLDILSNSLHDTGVIASHEDSRGSKISHMLPISRVETNRHILHEDIIITEGGDGSIRDQTIGLRFGNNNGLLGGHIGIRLGVTRCGTRKKRGLENEFGGRVLRLYIAKITNPIVSSRC